VADKRQKCQGNIKGKYYVDQTCIACNICSVIAPDNFQENMDEGLAYGNSFVFKQPYNSEEEELCIEAMKNCPMNAIGDDGT